MKAHQAVRAALSLACIGSLVPTLPALAQGAAEFEATDLETPFEGVRVVPGFGYRSKADIDGGGEFGETTLSVRGGPAFSFGDDLNGFFMVVRRLGFRGKRARTGATRSLSAALAASATR